MKTGTWSGGEAISKTVGTALGPKLGVENLSRCLLWVPTYAIDTRTRLDKSRSKVKPQCHAYGVFKLLEGNTKAGPLAKLVLLAVSSMNSTMSGPRALLMSYLSIVPGTVKQS